MNDQAVTDRALQLVAYLDRTGVTVDDDADSPPETWLLKMPMWWWEFVARSAGVLTPSLAVRNRVVSLFQSRSGRPTAADDPFLGL